MLTCASSVLRRLVTPNLASACLSRRPTNSYPPTSFMEASNHSASHVLKPKAHHQNLKSTAIFGKPFSNAVCSRCKHGEGRKYVDCCLLGTRTGHVMAHLEHSNTGAAIEESFSGLSRCFWVRNRRHIGHTCRPAGDPLPLSHTGHFSRIS